jgi:osomolarity two-component system, phosphorelay intermediate protein YPD1
MLIYIQKNEGPPDLQDYQDKLDYATFEQILEMDDDEEERDFSKGIVFGFFEQAEATFEKMEKAL